MEENSSEDFSYFVEIVKNDRIWYKCTLCPNKEFQTKTHRKYHKYFHDEKKPKPFNCVICGAGFISKSHYNYHIGTHTQEKPHKCPTCKKGFISQSKLNRHAKIHSGKVFQCHHCKKKFATTASRKQHEKTHSSEKSLRRSNRRLKNLRKQANNSEKDGPCFQCTTCDKKFIYAKDLKRHILVHTGERKFLCLICKEKHQRKDNLMRHIRRVHGQTEESAKKYVWEEEEDEEPRASPEATSEVSEEDTDVEVEESSSEDESSTSTTSESTDSESESETEDDEDVEMTGEDEELPGNFNTICNEEVAETVDVVTSTSTVDGSMWSYEPPSPEAMEIADDDDDQFKMDEAVVQVIFDKDELVITRVSSKVDDEMLEMGVGHNDIALDILPNEETEENDENIVGNIFHCDEDGTTFQEETVNAHINDYVCSTPKTPIHIDHSYAYVEYLPEDEDEVKTDKGFESIAATADADYANEEGEISNDCNMVDHNVSSCTEGEARFYNETVNGDETMMQFLFSLKEKPTSHQDLKIYDDTSLNDIVLSSYLDRKRITKKFLSFMYSEDDDVSDKETGPIGNIMVTDEFGVCREMEPGGLLTFTRDKLIHMEPLLIQKIILYSSLETEPLFCTIHNTVIVHQQQQNEIVELQHWSTTEENDNAMDNFNQEVTFHENNSINDDISNEENTWTTMNAMESNYEVLGLMDSQDIHDSVQYQSNFDERILEEYTGNSSGNESESFSHGDHYEEGLYQADLGNSVGNIENQDYSGDFHASFIPQPF